MCNLAILSFFLYFRFVINVDRYYMLVLPYFFQVTARFDQLLLTAGYVNSFSFIFVVLFFYAYLFVCVILKTFLLLLLVVLVLLIRFSFLLISFPLSHSEKTKSVR